MNPVAFILALMAGGAVLLVTMGLGKRRSSLNDLVDTWEASDTSRIARSVSDTSLEAKIMNRVNGAGLPLQPREALAAWIALSVVFTAIITLSAQNIAIALVIGFTLSTVLGWLYINARTVRRLRKFEDQLTRALTTLANLLESGRSLPQALESVAEQTAAPLGPELMWVQRQYSVGVELPDALLAVSQRVQSEEFRFFATAVDMNRVAGADLVGVLKSLVATLAERLSLRGELRARLAEVQLTKYVVGAAPAFTALLLTIVSPEQMRPLYTTAQGFVLLIAAVLFWIGGMVITSAMVKKVQP